MIEESKLNKAIQAVQDLIIEARKNAHLGKPGKELAEFLDHVEYLPALIVEKIDRTDFFEQYLEETCKAHNCEVVWNRYLSR